MNRIKADSEKLSQIMKTIGQCLNRKTGIYSNVQLIHESGTLTVRATNGIFLGEMSMQVQGEENEIFCVDGDMFSRVINLCKGMIEIISDGKNCVIKGMGRTRLPIINTTVKAPEDLNGSTVKMKAENFKATHSIISYAISTDASRMVLTGVLTETDGTEMKMVALNGFQTAIEKTACSGDEVSMIIPGAFMNLISASVGSADELQLITNKKIIQAKTASMTLQCALLSGQYPDYSRLLPSTYETELIIDKDQITDVLKSSMVVNNKLGTVKISIDSDELTVTNNSEIADFEAKVPCDTHGKRMMVAFNDHYILGAVNAIRADQLMMKFNTPVTPVLIQGKDMNGIHICMPVRLHEVIENNE